MALGLIFCSLLAPTVSASDEVTVTSKAHALQAAYGDLASKINACSDASCSEAAGLAAELATLGAQLASLQAERNGLNDCHCQSADDILAGLGILDDDLNVTVDDWIFDQ
ncbi:MAG: hypothetical protein AAF533_01725 [Acidobacteriota bacterium]